MTNTDILTWIKKNLSSYIKNTIAQHPNTFVTEELLAGITCRETGGLIAKHAAAFPKVLDLAKQMKGDYSDRGDGKGVVPHGYGFTQIDIGSFQWFISSGDWMNPYNCFSQSIAILEGNKRHIMAHNPNITDQDSLTHYSIAAYNCGAGNEDKVIHNHLDPDAYTTGHNYAKEVYEFSQIYKNLP